MAEKKPAKPAKPAESEQGVPATEEAKKESDKAQKSEKSTNEGKAQADGHGAAVPAAGGEHGAGGHEPAKPSALNQKITDAGAAAKKYATEFVKNLKGLGPALVASVKSVIQSVLDFPRLLIQSDLLTRILILGFIASVCLLCVTGVRLYKRFGPKPPSPHVKTHEEIAEERALEEQKQLKILASNIVFLEMFSANLVSKREKVKKFELELYVEADSPETAGKIKGHILQVREAVSSTIQGLRAEELITDEGKLKLKAGLLSAINSGLKKWAPGGVAKRIYFTRFQMD